VRPDLHGGGGSIVVRVRVLVPVVVHRSILLLLGEREMEKEGKGFSGEQFLDSRSGDRLT